ncbi:MAG: glutamate--tRNA ligase [Candidatus Paceibacterota bacterium]
MKDRIFQALFGGEPTEKKVVTRAAPSPTGRLHVGTARTILFNYLYAKKHGGKFLLRTEDTDPTRSKEEFEKDILNSIKWLHLEYDEFHRQSERRGTHSHYIKILLEKGVAYKSREQKKSGEGDVEVIRLRNPGRHVSFKDKIRGDITFDTTELGDFVIARSETDPLYHLAVVVDDFNMGVTHVIRGEDHISNTPRQILIQEALGFPRPIYAHLPLLLAPDKSKLSKRHENPNFSTSLSDYEEMGYLSEAVLNYLALLGWNPGTDREFFTLKELTQEFDFKGIQKGGAIFNLEKLDWFNQAYMRMLPPADFLKRVEQFLPPHFFSDQKKLKRVLLLMQERIVTFKELKELLVQGEYDYFFEEPEYDPSLLLWKGKGELSLAREHLERILFSLEEVTPFLEGEIKQTIWSYAEEKGRGEVLWPFRVALSGREKSPSPFELAEILGKQETLERLRRATEKIDEKRI